MDHIAGDQRILCGPADQTEQWSIVWPGAGMNWIDSLSAKSLFTICARWPRRSSAVVLATLSSI
jgi:hypothetical protein